MAYQSQMARQALRSALRSHPNASSVLTDGRKVNDLRLDELYAALRTLGENPDGIARAALASPQPAPIPLGTIDGTEVSLQVQDDAELRQEENTLAENDAVEAELGAIRALITTGGFTALDGRLRELVVAAHKAPVEVIREVMIPCPAGTSVAPGVTAKQTGEKRTWRDLFNVTGPLGNRETAMWDGKHPDTPAANTRYVFPHPATEICLSQLHRGKNVMAFGPKGCGKTDWCQQLAALTGRPFVLISCNSGTDSGTLLGMTVPAIGGGVTWQDGQLTKAIRTPGAVICIDEPSIARPGALMVFQNVLAFRQLFIDETGEKIKVAPGVLFVCCDNTNGTGGGSRRGYTDTNRLNTAYLDRWGVCVDFNYLAPDVEADVLVGYVGCTKELATLLVSAATVTRAAADQETLSSGISFRRLISWAELLTDGIGAEDAFRTAVLNFANEQDREAIREQCLLSYDAEQVRKALNPSAPAAANPALSNPTPQGRQAAQDFTAYHRN